MLSPRDPMRKVQQHLCLCAVIALAFSCSSRRTPPRGVTAGGVSLVGDRGGSWPGGVGAVLRFREREGVLVIERAPADLAAARAGLRAGDVVVAIDGQSLSGRERDEVVSRLRGEVGSVVVLRVRGADGGTDRDVRVERGPYQRRE